MHFTSHETKTRHKNTEDKLTATREAIEDPAFRGALGGEYADAQLSVLDSFYVPNVAHGQVTVPDVYKDDPNSLPVVSIFPREKLQLSPDIKSQHPVQEDSSVKYLAGLSGDSVEKTREALRLALSTDAIERQEYVDGLGKGKGVVGKVSIPNGRTHVDTQGMERARGFVKKFVDLRPILLLPISNQYFNSLTGVHEIGHILQSFRDPIVRLDDGESSDEALRRELEAYTVQALAATGLYLNSTNEKFQNRKFTQGNDGASAIAYETARINNGKPDPYEVSPILKQHLRDHVFTRAGRSLYLR